MRGGASLIDIKEPLRGSLGRADEATIAAVVKAVAERLPVSAALGELKEQPQPARTPGISYSKWGLSGWGRSDAWCSVLTETQRQLQDCGDASRLVAVAYADWRRAGAPSPANVAAFACRLRCGAFLLDTWGKDGSCLLDWMSVVAIARMADVCHESGVPVALAGSLRSEHFPALTVARPDWVALRGAVCRGGRGGSIDWAKVRAARDSLRRLKPVSIA
jgi:uncharacterized protein (UPF0264 family)